MKAMDPRLEDADAPNESASVAAPAPIDIFSKTLSFALRTYEIAVRRWGDPNTLPFIHTSLVFLFHMTKFPAAMVHLETAYPWKLTAVMLNSLMKSGHFERQIDTDEFPAPPKNQPPRPLPEDHALRGLLYAEDYLPIDWFSNMKLDEDEKYLEQASMIDERRERIIWLGRKIANSSYGLTWNQDKGDFHVTEQYDVDLEASASAPPIEEVAAEA